MESNLKSKTPRLKNDTNFIPKLTNRDEKIIYNKSQYYY